MGCRVHLDTLYLPRVPQSAQSALHQQHTARGARARASQRSRLRPGAPCAQCAAAAQIEAEFKRFSKFLDPEVRIANYVGGIARKLNEDELKDSGTRPHVVIGTPGRLMDLVESGKLPLKDIKYFVVDECDKILDQLGASPAAVGGGRVSVRGRVGAAADRGGPRVQTCAAWCSASTSSARRRSR